MTKKLLFGFILGYIGYMAYVKLRRTQTVIVDTTQTVPLITGGLSTLTPQYNLDNIAGLPVATSGRDLSGGSRSMAGLR